MEKFHCSPMKILDNRYVKGFLKLIFSNLGLCFLVTAYCVAGAFLFQYLEGDIERNRYKLITETSWQVQQQFETLESKVTNFGTMCVNENVSDQCEMSKAVELVEAWVKEYELFIMQKRNESNGDYAGQKAENISEALIDWSIPSAILFTTTILTTIGYGSVTPKTEVGQLTVMLYAVLAIPLMSMFLINVGTSLGRSVRWLFNKIASSEFLRKMKWCRKKKQWATRVAPVSEAHASYDQHKEGIQFDSEVPVSLVMIMGILYIILGMLLFHFTEHWTMMEALYFTLVSLSTIGFGDFVPSANAKTLVDQMHMVMTTAYLFVGLALFAMCISLMTGVLKEYRQVLMKMIQKLKKTD